ncbi:uncharacterized protein [Littorina saxatilis]|uniref:uncharacterized protein n=1 Tax=Littorina saxatilis TaxID=31220 RepID=UPI0038B55254
MFIGAGNSSRESTSKEGSGSRSRHQPGQQEPDNLPHFIELSPSSSISPPPTPPYRGLSSYHFTSSALTPSPDSGLSSDRVPNQRLIHDKSLATSTLTSTTAGGVGAGGGSLRKSNDMATLNKIWDRSDTSPRHRGQAGQAFLERDSIKKDGGVSAISGLNDEKQPQSKSSRKRKNPSFSSGGATDLQTEGNSHQPIFSRSWQFSKSFSSKGGRLQGVDSDVILFVPGDAVDDAGEDVTRGCGTIPTQRKRHQSISNNQKEQATPEEDQMNNSEESDATAAVTIRGATSIDLKGVRGKLKLSATESICSPVVEYYAGENVVFKKPVCISLPHFLPPDADKSNVKVYQASRSSDGEICVELLKLADTPNHDEGLEEGEKGFMENTASSLGSFYLLGEKRITIFTNHFTGYFCTHCQHGTDPPYLKFRLYGRHLQRRTRDVDLTLFIWDLRLDIRDFRKAGLPDPNDELTLVTSATLEPMTADMISDVRVGVRIHLPLETSGEDAIWRHKQRPNGSPRLQPEKSFDPRMFYPCLCHTEPERAVWSIQCREDHVPPWWFESYIDVGYIHRGDQSFNFLQAPEPQTLQVCLKLMNEVKSASAQTEADLGENTHAKQLSETTTSSTRPVHSDEAMQTSCSFPLEQTGAFQAIPRNASNSDASNYHGSCTRSHNSCTHSQAATPSSEMAALPLNPEDSAASPSTGHQVAGDNSTKQVIYTNCTFNMQANKTTTNNNVGKLHDMNFGNTTNIASEGDQGVGTPQHHMMKLDLPSVEEVVQQSLAHNSHIENGTDRSLE